MKLRTGTIIGLLYFLLICFLQSCGQREDCSVYPNIERHYYLPKEEMDSFPYIGIDTLEFINEAKEKAIYISKTKEIGHSLVESEKIPTAANCPRSKNIYIDGGVAHYVCQNMASMRDINFRLKTDYTHGKIIGYFYVEMFGPYEPVVFMYSELNPLPITDSILFKGEYKPGKHIPSQDVWYNISLGIIKYIDRNGKVWRLVDRR